MQRFYCGIDLGTTNLKVLLCDEAGHVAAKASCPTPRQERDGAPVTDPAEILTAIEALLDDAWSQAGRGGRIAAIASAGVGEDGFLVGPDLSPTDLSIPWFDRRAEAEAAELAACCDVTALSGIAFEPTRTATKWLWLARHGSAPPAGALWLALTDWPLVAWSGRPVMTEALAARTACWDIARREWINAALRAAKAPPLPPVLPAGAVIGPLLEGSFPVRLGAADTGTLAVCGGHDHPTAAAAIRAAHPGAIVDSLGTAELLYAEAGAEILPAEALVRTIPSGPGMVAACLHVFEFDRYFSAFPPDRLRAELDGTAPQDAVTPRIRARLEIAAMVAAQVLTRMEAAGIPPGELFVTGGRARSDRLMQLRADVLGRAIRRVEERELCGLGAAIIAASGAGQAVAPVLKTRLFTPDAGAATAHAAECARRQEEITALLLHGPR